MDDLSCQTENQATWQACRDDGLVPSGECDTEREKALADCEEKFESNRDDCRLASIFGCTDENAANFNPDATEDDGTCESNAAYECGPGWEALQMEALDTCLEGPDQDRHDCVGRSDDDQKACDSAAEEEYSACDEDQFALEECFEVGSEKCQRDRFAVDEACMEKANANHADCIGGGGAAADCDEELDVDRRACKDEGEGWQEDCSDENERTCADDLGIEPDIDCAREKDANRDECGQVRDEAAQVCEDVYLKAEGSCYDEKNAWETACTGAV
jgi:hypothetical protein